jgi:diacylglycerol kinase family enzyme
VALAAFRGKPVRSGRAVDRRGNVTGFTVRGMAPFPYQVDGDYLGEVTSLRFRYEPDVIDLVIP